MKRTLQWNFFWVAVCGAFLNWGLGLPSAQAVTGLVASPADNLLDTTNYSSLGANTGYWFANFGNPTPVTGDAMNSFEASNIPYWIHLDSNPAHIGKADDGVTNDASIYTGFSFSDDLPISSSTGGHTTWNILTLPDGTTGVSGAAVDTSNASNNTDNWIHMRFLPGAPSTAKFWVVTDNWGVAGLNADPNTRIRVRIKLLDGSFADIGDGPQVDTSPGNPVTNNGLADAYAFTLTNITAGEGLVVRLGSGAAPSHGSVAGMMFNPVPEPTSAVLSLLGFSALGFARRKR